MPYTGSDPDLVDLQAQITTLSTNITTGLAGLQTQIKQVTLTLEQQLAAMISAFNALKAYVTTRIPS